MRIEKRQGKTRLHIYGKLRDKTGQCERICKSRFGQVSKKSIQKLATGIVFVFEANVSKKLKADLCIMH